MANKHRRAERDEPVDRTREVQIKQSRDAYAEGYDAFLHAPTGETVNPYPQGSDDYRLFNDGWADAARGR